MDKAPFKGEYLKINETEYHTLDKIKAIVRRCEPSVLILESQKPSVNNRVLRHARYFVRNGWIQKGMKIITRHRRGKKGSNELNMVSVMLEKKGR